MRIQIFGTDGRDDIEHFELIREINSGTPVSVLTTGSPFSPYTKDMAARVIKTDQITNFPISIATYSINSEALSPMLEPENIVVNKVHTMPTDYPEMLDLSPGGYQRLSQAIEADETVAVNFLE